MKNTSPVQRIPRIIIRSEKDMERFADALFPERIIERAAEGDFLAGDIFDGPDHPGHPSNYGDD